MNRRDFLPALAAALSLPLFMRQAKAAAPPVQPTGHTHQASDVFSCFGRKVPDGVMCDTPWYSAGDGRKWYAALNMRTDSAAFVMVSRAPDGVVDVLPFFWIPNARAGVAVDRFTTVTEGGVVDYDIIRRDIVALSKRYRIEQIAVDRWNSCCLTEVLHHHGLPVGSVGMGYRGLDAPTQRLRFLIRIGLIRWSSFVLTEQIMKMVLVSDARGRWKPHASCGPGVFALVMALGLELPAREDGMKEDGLANGIDFLEYTRRVRELDAAASAVLNKKAP